MNNDVTYGNKKTENNTYVTAKVFKYEYMKGLICSIIELNGRKINYALSSIIKTSDLRLQNNNSVIDIKNYILPGDIIRARLISVTQPKHFVLSVSESCTGVIQANCPMCLNCMHIINENTMHCGTCQKSVKRQCAVIL